MSNKGGERLLDDSEDDSQFKFDFETNTKFF